MTASPPSTTSHPWISGSREGSFSPKNVPGPIGAGTTGKRKLRTCVPSGTVSLALIRRVLAVLVVAPPQSPDGIEKLGSHGHVREVERLWLLFAFDKDVHPCAGLAFPENLDFDNFIGIEPDIISRHVDRSHLDSLSTRRGGRPRSLRQWQGQAHQQSLSGPMILGC